MFNHTNSRLIKGSLNFKNLKNGLQYKSTRKEAIFRFIANNSNSDASLNKSQNKNIPPSKFKDLNSNKGPNETTILTNNPSNLKFSDLSVIKNMSNLNIKSSPIAINNINVESKSNINIDAKVINILVIPHLYIYKYIYSIVNN
jgi:hypothetical protein